MDTEKYIKLFNHGYFLSKHEPKVLKKLMNATEKLPDIFEPLKAGERQYMEEKVQQRIQNIKDSKMMDRGRNRDGSHEMG